MSEAENARRAAAEVRRDRHYIHVGDGPPLRGGRCMEQALRHHGGSIRSLERFLGERGYKVDDRSSDPDTIARELERYAASLEPRRGVTPQKPVEKPTVKVEKPKKTRTARQRPAAALRASARSVDSHEKPSRPK